MATMRLARDLRNGWGVNAPFYDSTTAALTATALTYLGTRWVRMQFAGGNTAAMTAVQDALVAQAAPDPNLRLNLLLNGYVQDAAANTWTAQQGWALTVFAKHGPNGTTILKAIENINECNNPDEGQGSRGPNDTINKTGLAAGGPVGQADDPTANANFVDWQNQVSPWMATNTLGVERVSGSVVYFFGANFSTALNVSNLIDYGCFHDYGSPGTATGGVSSQPGNPGNLFRTYGYAQAGICPGKSMVMSEFGASTESGTTGYSLIGAARYHAMALLDFWAAGGHRAMVYNLLNNAASTETNTTTSNEDNFGLFWPDGTPKPSATVLRNMQDLLSLGNNKDAPANFSDTAAFTPTYDGSTLTISGVSPAGEAGVGLVLPKSDGSTIIPVYGQPAIDTGGTATTPAANHAIVDLGSSQSWKVWDISGNGGAPNFTAAMGSSLLASGTGSTVPLTLYGLPRFVELAAPAVVTPPVSTGVLPAWSYR